VFRSKEENMAASKIETDPKEISMKSQNTGTSRKTKFEVFGEEMIEKELKPSGNSGRVYLPLDWVGQHIKIIRID
jgi:putative transposon-encoded protein